MKRNGIIFLPICTGAIIFLGLATMTRHGGGTPVPIDPELEITSSIRGPGVARPIPKGGGTYRVGEPYVIAGRTYVPREDPNYRAEGVASWYGDWFHGRTTANGEKYDMYAISAAHPTLPLPSYARVTNLENNRSLIVRVNDRGPYRDGRIIDMSVNAARLLGFYERGLARVRVEYVGPARLEGSDNARLAATLRREAPAESETFAALRQMAAFEQPEALTPAPHLVGLFADHRPGKPDARENPNDGFPNVIFD